LVGSGVAVGAIQLQGLLQRNHLVLDLRVALLALHVVLGDVNPVKKGGVVEGIEALLDVVAGPASLLFGGTVPLGHIGVAFGTGHQVPDDLIVVDGNALVLHVGRRRVASQTSSQGLTLRLILEMTEATGGGRHREMLALDDLGVAGGAAEFLAAAEIPQVLLVVEANATVRHDPQPLLQVAALPGTRRVLDLRPGFLFVGPGDVLHHLIRRLDLSHGFRFDPRSVVTLDARNHVVGGVLPGLVVRFHVVAVVAEPWLGRILQESYRSCSAQDAHDHCSLDQEDQPTPSFLHDSIPPPMPQPLLESLSASFHLFRAASKTPPASTIQSGIPRSFLSHRFSSTDSARWLIPSDQDTIPPVVSSTTTGSRV